MLKASKNYYPNIFPIKGKISTASEVYFDRWKGNPTVTRNPVMTYICPCTLTHITQVVSRTKAAMDGVTHSLNSVTMGTHTKNIHMQCF